MATSVINFGRFFSGTHRVNLLQIGGIQRVASLLVPSCSVLSTCPSRTNYADWRMRRDAKRRQMTKENSKERRLLNCIRKNTLLPDELRVVADQEIAAFPRDSCYVRIRQRCAVTSRPRGVVKPWRLSRIMWRQEVDANHMSGVKRSCW